MSAIQVKDAFPPAPASIDCSPTSGQALSPMNASIKEIYTNFLARLDYHPADPVSNTSPTHQSLVSILAPYDVGGQWFKVACQNAAALADYIYSGHSPEVRLQIARYTWFIFYMDDLGHEFPEALEGFQGKILVNEDPDGSVLKAFRAHLVDMYRLYDTVPANCIALSAMNFMSGCRLEQMPSICDMKISSAAHSWPYFLRNKTGTAEAFAFMLFPKDLGIEMPVYIQVIDDIGMLMNLANDILSFYKEELVGEKNNYMYNRSKVTERSILETLQDTVDQTVDAYLRITEVLQDTDAIVPWKRFVNGLLAFHYAVKRYHLNDLGL